MAQSYPSLFAQSDTGSLTGAVDWMTGTMPGNVATGLCVVAIAVVGLMMLSGRLALREGGRVVLGCFVLFGAPALAVALRDLADGGAAVTPVEAAAPALPPRPPLATSTYDPYAGASLWTNR